MTSQTTKPVSVMGLGVGAFTQGMLRVLRENGAEVTTYLTRDYAHLPPSLEGPAFTMDQVPDPSALVERYQVDFLLPMSIDWAHTAWGESLSRRNTPILSPTGEAMKIERDRDFAKELCHQYGIRFPQSVVARNRLEATAFLEADPRPYVIKNPLCSPGSPIHTILCETAEDTRSWLEHLNYAEGVFLQQFMGNQEASHVALVSHGEIHSLVTNQEYKRAFTGNMGIIAGAPLGGIVEADPQDRYGLARELLEPLRPWLERVDYHGPIQVTAVRKEGAWHVLEYNIRLGLMCGPIILRMLQDPVATLHAVVHNRPTPIRFHPERRFACSVTLAGYGYPFIQVHGPELPLEVTEPFDCDVWWNEIKEDPCGRRYATGHRIADVVGISGTLEEAVAQAYRNIAKIRCLASYYRTDIGQSGWPAF